MRVDYETLMHEHDALDRLAEQLDRAIGEASGPSTPALAARERLSTALIAHVAKEDSAIYPRLIGGNDASAAAAAQEVIHEFRDLMVDWIDYARDWDRDRALAEWDSFAAATRALLARLRGRIKRENELLYPLALRASHIRLRA